MSTTQPNFLFILSDDQGPWATGKRCPGLQTPNLDRLADRGLDFTRMFCASPVCSPARASILTGLMPSQHGIQDWIRRGSVSPDLKERLPDSVMEYKWETGPADYIERFTAYTDVLADAGYTLTLSGKWHMGDSLKTRKGYRRWLTIPTGGSHYMQPDIIEDGTVRTEHRYLSDIFADHAIVSIEESAASGHPWYAQLNFTAPHDPWAWDQHPKKWIDTYRDHDFAELPLMPDHPNLVSGVYYGTDEVHRARVGYYAAISAMDEAIGRVLDALEATGQADSTYVIFMGDNGMNMGHHGCWGKGNATYPQNMYEESIKVPFIVAGPGIQTGVTDVMASACDLFPSILTWAGLDIPADYVGPGRELVGLCTGAEDEHRAVISEEYGHVRMIRTAELKLVQYHGIADDQLFDLKVDPDETVNRIHDPNYVETRNALAQTLKRFFDDYHTPGMEGVQFDNRGFGQLHPVHQKDAFAHGHSHK